MGIEHKPATWTKDLLIKPCFALKATSPISTIRMYTPDMALFIHKHGASTKQPSIWFNNGIIYTVAPTISDCYSIEELLLAYSAVDPGITTALTAFIKISKLNINLSEVKYKYVCG